MHGTHIEEDADVAAQALDAGCRWIASHNLDLLQGPAFERCLTDEQAQGRLRATGHIDPSSSNPFTTNRARALAYVEEAFAALVDGTLALEGPPHSSPGTDFEARVRGIANRLLAVAQSTLDVAALRASVQAL